MLNTSTFARPSVAVLAISLSIIASFLLQGCKNLDEPLPTPGHPSQIKDKWRVSRITTRNDQPNQKTVVDFKYNAFNKATICAQIHYNVEGDPAEYNTRTFAYNAQQQLIADHIFDSSWHRSEGDPDIIILDLMHMFKKYTYNAAGRVTNISIAYWTGSWDSTDLDDLKYDIETTVTYEGDSVIHIQTPEMSRDEKIIFDQNGNIIKKVSDAQYETIYGPYDHSRNVDALATVDYGSQFSTPHMGLLIFSKNNYKQIDYEGSITKYQHTYNRDSLVTQRAIYNSAGSLLATEYYEYIKVK